jgi:hypothetical protein
MKSLIAAALMVMSFSTFSTEASSVESLLSILPLGNHSGINAKNEKCVVSVSETNYPTKTLVVEIISPTKKIFKVINEGSFFKFNGELKEYVQQTRHYVDETRSSFVERSISTMGIGNLLVDVEIIHEVVISRERSIQAGFCTIMF